MKNGHTFCMISWGEKIWLGIQLVGLNSSACNQRITGHIRFSKF